MANVLSPAPKFKAFDNNGNPANGYRLFTYAGGTSTKVATYSTPDLSSPNTDPVVLDFRGEANVWTVPNTSYKFILAPPGFDDPPTNPIWTVDNIVSAQLLSLFGGVDTGSANSYVLTFSANFSSYVDGTVIYWIPSNSNTLSVPTLNVNGLGAVNILNFNGTILSAGTIVAGQIIQVMYLGGVFKILNSLPITGSLNCTLTGVVGAVTGIVNYTLSGGIVAVRLATTLSGTSNSTSCTITGLPTFLFPSSGQVVALPNSAFLDNSASVNTVRASVSLSFPGTITFQLNGSSTGFTAAGAKGIGAALVLVWVLAS